MDSYKMVLQAESLGLEWEYSFESGSDELAIQYACHHAKVVLSEWSRYKWLLLFTDGKMVARLEIQRREPTIKIGIPVPEGVQVLDINDVEGMYSTLKQIMGE